MLFKRIKEGVDRRLRKEQIFLLRNILEQAREWRSGLYIHFVDFEKALWNIMRRYGMPNKTVRVIADMYKGRSPLP